MAVRIALLNLNCAVMPFSLITNLTPADRKEIRKKIKFKEKQVFSLLAFECFLLLIYISNI